MKRLAGIVLGISAIANIFLLLFIFQRATPPSLPATELAQEYPLLSKRIFTESQNDIIINFVTLRKKINEYIASHNLSQENAATHFSLYFEYLPSGNSIGVNEKTPFIAASLLKVPIIMGVYKYIESGKLNKETVLTLRDSDLDPMYGSLWKRGIGATIQVIDAIKLTLTESDNTAKAVLFNNVPLSTLNDVFDYLDIPNDTKDNAPVVSAKNYSSILRSLYLSSYLTQEHSSEILELLTQSKFNDKLAAGIPPSVKVAHKIGVHDTTSATESIYTDCGIIYVPKRPYALCFMMRDSEKNAQLHMKALSKMIYDYVANANTSK